MQHLPPVSELEKAPAAEVSLTRKEKEQLLDKMYRLPHWIAIIRLFAYRTITMEKARVEIKPIAEEFGKAKTADATEALVEIVPGVDSLARLKPHIRRMAFQILGPESKAADSPVELSSEPQNEPDIPRPPNKRKSRNRAQASATAVPPTTPTSSASHSAIMQQYQAAKEKHPDMLLVFRCGDYYELFGADAETAHRLLGLTLTTRDRTLAMAGFPHHQLEVYLHKLLKEGQRVAICEPVEESLAHGPIRREVSRIVTPGAMVEQDAQEAEENAPSSAERPVKQPRHFVLKQFEKWMTDMGQAYVAIKDVKRTTPAVAPYVASLDFIVLRGDEKLLVTVRPNLQLKHLNAIREIQKLFGPEYHPVRIWPTEGSNEWQWQEFPVHAAKAQ